MGGLGGVNGMAPVQGIKLSWKIKFFRDLLENSKKCQGQYNRLEAHLRRCKHRSRLLILGLLAWYGATRQLYTHGREIFWNFIKSSMVLHRYGIWSMIISTCSITFTVSAHQHLVHCSYDIYRLRVTFIIFLNFLYIFSFHPTVKVKVNATFPVHLSREHLICSSRHKREPFSHALIFPAQTFPRWQPHRYIQSTWIIYH